MFRKNVKNLSDVLNQCMRQNGLETPLLQKRLVDAWDSVMGPGIAAYTGDKFIKNQTLFVKITNPALRNDLSMMKSSIVRNLNNAVGTMVIADVRIY
jgi:predicted nucleic acid-binding Zn ribbon protein